MIVSKSEIAFRKPEIDLTGPDGNAFVLLGLAQRFGEQLGMEAEAVDAIKQDMKSSDYEHLLKVFDQAFGEYVVLYR